MALSIHKNAMTTMVEVRLNHRGKPIGCVIAKYLSTAIAVIVNILAQTHTPTKIKLLSLIFYIIGLR